ncbi:hypothetical protein PTKIN_Ptkin09bG0024800 [Pterospermum kingtungense]
MYKGKGKAEEKRDQVSVLDVNEAFLHKILSRDNSSLDNAVTVPYRRSVGEVPFRWEVTPGTPRHQELAPKKDHRVIAPPAPVRLPPAASWNGRKTDDWTCMDMSRETSRGWFWKKSKKKCVKTQGNGEFDNYFNRSSSSTNSRSSSSTSSKGTSSKFRNFTNVLLRWPFK